MGQCTTLADRDRHGHIGGGGGRTGDVSWQRAVSRPPCALDTGRSPRPVRSPLTMATGNSTVHVNNMEINRGKTQTSVKQPTASNVAFIRYYGAADTIAKPEYLVTCYFYSLVSLKFHTLDNNRA